MKPMRLLAPLSAALLALAVVGGGCVEQLDEIDRTQANALKKADFYGVWYRMAVISDMPASAGFGFVGQTNFGGSGGKVIFDIQETQLVVYPVAETVRDGDKQWHRRKIRTYWVEGKEDQFLEVLAGNPVAMYPITSHFDIQRDYSTATGAQSNVLSENTTDRPWWKRKYIRVNWMGNSFVELLFPQGAMQYSAADHYEQEHDLDDPNRFRMEKDYFHFTRRLFGQPMSTGACSTYSLAAGDCSGAAFDVRISFRRTHPKVVNDFEIRNYHNEPDAERFGYFLSERHTYDPEYGLTYRGQDYKAQIWNLWQKSVELIPVKDAKGKDIKCLSNADCERPAVCDQADWFVQGSCSVAKGVEYTKRGLRPIVYHLSADHPESSRAAVYRVADNWSKVFQETVSWLFFWEEIWAKDGIPGFGEPGDLFGQRGCDAHADCAKHALAQGETPYQESSNTLLVGTKNGVLAAYDRVDACDAGQRKLGLCSGDDRPKLDGGAYVMFVNATPNSAPASLSVAGAKVEGVAFQVGAYDAHKSGVVIAKGEAGKRHTLEVTSGTASATLTNALLSANRIYYAVYYGGSDLALVEAQLGKRGVRMMHAIQTGTTKVNGAEVGAGPLVEAGVNGVRVKADLKYGAVSEYIHVTGSTQHAVFLTSGQRADVSCISQAGVGRCYGWKQTLRPADRTRREQILSELPPMFVLCENVYRKTCSAQDKGNASVLNDCRYWGKYNGKDGKELNPCDAFVPQADQPKVIGDSRYNYIYWVTNVHASSPLGYGPSAADPDTGMLFWGTANIYGASLISYAQWGKDLVDLLNGDLSVDEVASGKYIRDYMESLDKAAHEDSLFGAAREEERAQRFDTGSVEDARKRATLDISTVLSGAPMDKVSRAQAEKQLAGLQDPKKLGEKLMKELDFFELGEVVARMDKIRGTPLERAMINDEVALVASGGAVQPGDALAPEAVAEISPAGWASPKREVNERLRMQLLGYNNVYLAEFADPALIALAKRLKCDAGETPTDQPRDSVGGKSCYKGDALRLALHDALYRGVLEHEIGHTIGLRHNFSASADVLNYFDPYYDPAKGRERDQVLCADIQTQFGSVSGNDLCEDSLGETCQDLSCAADGDCPEGLSCGAGKCLDSNGIKVGQCVGTVRSRVPCTEATAASACGSNAVCDTAQGFCGAKFACQADDDCLAGEACSGGFCQAIKDGSFRTSPLFNENSGPVAKYMPRAEMTTKEVENRRTEFQYSSIMDYGQKINADFMGLGKYDYAAVKYGYGRLLEVFADMSYMRDQLKQYAKNTAQTEEASAWRMNTDSWEFGGTITNTFYYLNNWMPPEYLLQRDAVPGHQVQAELALEKYGRSSYDRTYFEVPYKYCSDEYRGGSLACYYFDTGSHMQEIVHHAQEQLREYYLFDAFKRERIFFGTGGNPLAYMSRVIDRYLTPVSAAARFYAVYNNIFRVYSFFPFYDNHPMYMLGLKRSSEDAFRTLTALVTSPAPGSYQLDAPSNTYVNVSYEANKVKDASALNVGLGEGRLPWTTFATENGYYYANHPAWIGSYWDKLAAIQVMTSSSASFLTDFVGEQLPLFRGTAIGFNTVYPKELSAILGGIAAGAIDEIGGYAVKGADGKMRYVPRDPFAPADKTAARVPPSINNLSLRLYAAWQAISNLPAGFDPSFTDSMTVWIKGSSHQHDLGACTKFGQCGADANAVQVVDVMEFEDPWGKKTYVAPRVNYNKDYFSPTYYMLKKLNDLKAKWLVAQGDEKQTLAAQMKTELEVVDYFRLLYKIYGSIGM